MEYISDDHLNSNQSVLDWSDSPHGVCQVAQKHPESMKEKNFWADNTKLTF